MSKAALIVGESGTGKSTSVSFLDPKETFIINVQGKDLPFRGYSKNYRPIPEEGPPSEGNLLNTSDPKLIAKVVTYVSENRPEIKNIIIDDWQYVAATEFMNKAEQKGFDKFTSIGKNIWTIAYLPKLCKRDDLILFYLTHSESAVDETTGGRYMKAKTVGKLVDNVVTLEGMFTIVLFTDVEKTKEGIRYSFLTQNTGSNTAKSPMGMFETLKIPNDLNMVRNTVYEYYN